MGSQEAVAPSGDSEAKTGSSPTPTLCVRPGKSKEEQGIHGPPKLSSHLRRLGGTMPLTPIVQVEGLILEGVCLAKCPFQESALLALHL